MKTSVLIVGPRGEGWGYVRAARELGHGAVVLLERRAQRRASPEQLALADQVLTAEDLASPEELFELVDELRFTRVLSAVVAGCEEHAVCAAKLAARHGLGAVSPKAARASGDRAFLLAALTAAALPRVPGAHRAETLAEALEAGAALGYPCVLRPQREAGDPVRVEGPDALEAAFNEAGLQARAARVPAAVLVESYVPGDELTLVGYVQHGRYTPLAVAERRVGPFPYMQPLGALVRPAGAVPAARLTGWYMKALTERLEVRTGVVRAHVRLNAEEAPCLTGFGTGPGPDLLGELVRMTTGVDLAVLDLALRTGDRVPAATETSLHAAGVSYVASPRHTGRTYRRLARWREIVRVEGVVAAQVSIAPGEMIPPRHDRSSRLAHIVYAGHEYWQATAVRSKVERGISVQ